MHRAADWLRNRMYHFWPWWYYEVYYPEREREPKRREWRKQMAVWYDSHRALFAAADRQWDHAVLGFRIWREYSGEEAAKRVPAINKLLGELKLDEAGKAKAARDFAFVLCDNKMFDEARSMLPHVKNLVDNLWLSYEIENRANQLPAAQLALEQIVAQKDPATSLAGKKRLAWFHKERTRQYDKAIALYLDISQPPGTLWDLQECYRRAGKKVEAYTVLTELASIFPSEAARSVWIQASTASRTARRTRPSPATAASSRSLNGRRLGSRPRRTRRWNGWASPPAVPSLTRSVKQRFGRIGKEEGTNYEKLGIAILAMGVGLLTLCREAPDWRRGAVTARFYQIEARARRMVDNAVELLENNEESRAVGMLEAVPRMFADAPSRFRAHLELGRHLTEKRQFDRAAAELRRAQGSEDRELQAEALLLLGRCHLARGNSGDAAMALL